MNGAGGARKGRSTEASEQRHAQKERETAAEQQQAERQTHAPTHGRSTGRHSKEGNTQNGGHGVEAGLLLLFIFFFLALRFYLLF
jgi:hypothetical protein